jgi:hypothetical protein
MTAVMETRCKKLSDLGLQYNGSEYCLEDINVHWTELTCDTDREFDIRYKKIAQEIERRRKACIS